MNNEEFRFGERNNKLAQLPQPSREIEAFLNMPATETLYLSDFLF